MNNLEVKDITENSLYQEATQLHHKIISSGSLAVTSIIEMSRCLKKMRDDKQYTHLGFESFDDYVEDAVKIKARQAYNYISTYEKLGPEVMQLNANLGITKLKMLSELSESKREEVMQTEDIEDMSTREMKELVEKLNKAQEQISFLSEQVEKRTEDKQTAQSESDSLQKEIENLQKTINQLQSAKEKPNFDQEKQKLMKEMASEHEKDLKQTEKKMEEKYMQEIQKVAREKEESLLRASELEKKLSLSQTSDAAIIDHLFGEVSGLVNKMIGIINKMPEDSGNQYKRAIKKYFDMIEQKLI